jgi:hypothetical protein
MPVEFNGEVSRGILREGRSVDGSIFKNTEEEVFRKFPGMTSNSHRYSHGGPEGNFGMYGTVGNSRNIEVVETILNETLGAKSNADLIVATKSFEFKKVLDLTDENNLKVLGIDKNTLVLEVDDSVFAYRQTQIIGDLARKKGFEGIIYKPSLKNGKETVSKNIIILRDVVE